MLLTLKPSAQNGIKGPPHDYAIVRQSVPAPRSSSPAPPPPSERPAAAAPPQLSPDPSSSMEPPRSGLPPPSSLALPPPDLGFAMTGPMAQSQSQSRPPPQQPAAAAPQPPPQRRSSDDSYWLARAEEDRRRQEEEKTRQESLRLEQRRIEQNMLRDSLQAGVPPQMVPLIFAGISSAGAPPAVLEWTQQYMAQLTPGHRGTAAPPPPALSHSPQRRPPHVRRESHTLPPNPYGPPPQQPVRAPGVLLSQPLPSSGASPTPHSHRAASALQNGPPEPRSRAHPGEPQMQQPPINLSNVQYAPGSSVPANKPAPGKPDHQPRRSPPALYFHHWVPPNQSQPHTPSGRPRQESPVPSQQSRRSDYQSSPGIKRKASGTHQQAPAPSSRQSEVNFSQTSRPGSPASGTRVGESMHTRQRSETSTSYEYRGPEHSVKHGSRIPSPTRSATHLMPPTEDSNSEKDRSRADDQDRSRDVSPSAGTARFSYPRSGQYGSSIEAAPDSDPDNSPRPSVTG